MRSAVQQMPRAIDTPGPAAQDEFLRDVLAGLSQPQKRLSCTWLYDRRGSELFEQITEVPEYYPTRAEVRILQKCAPEIAALAGPGAALVELGSGSSHKTPLVLSSLDRPACYVPVDISAEFLGDSVRALQRRFPSLPIHPVVADFNRLGALPDAVRTAKRRVAFFPGSTIGNLAPFEAVALLRQVARLVGDGGLLVLGADATQDPSVLVPAYDDAQGVTAAFNLNLLARINRELGADFDLGAFRHLARFDPHLGRVEMHLVSRRKQSVRVAGSCFRFDPGESIHTENSYKYGLAQLRSMARRSGWAKCRTWTDEQACFAVHAFACVDRRGLPSPALPA